MVSADELALGVGVRLAVLGEARGERALQRHVLSRENGIGAQAVAEPQAPLKRSASNIAGQAAS
jgi:hypothetical protein